MEVECGGVDTSWKAGKDRLRARNRALGRYASSIKRDTRKAFEKFAASTEVKLRHQGIVAAKAEKTRSDMRAAREKVGKRRKHENVSQDTPDGFFGI